MRFSPLDSAVARARALGHPARLRIVAMLEHGALCPCQITEALGLASSTVSAHLRELRLSGLTEERKDGRWVYVSLSGDAEAAPWLDIARASAAKDPQVSTDRDLIRRMQQIPLEDLCRLGYDEACTLHAPATSGCGSRTDEAPEGE